MFLETYVVASVYLISVGINLMLYGSLGDEDDDE